jgi:hypothetical protein
MSACVRGGVLFFLTVSTCAGRAAGGATADGGGPARGTRLPAWWSLPRVAWFRSRSAARASGQRLFKWWGGTAALGGRGTDQRCRCAPGEPRAKTLRHLASVNVRKASNNARYRVH